MISVFLYLRVYYYLSNTLWKTYPYSKLGPRIANAKEAGIMNDRFGS